MVKNTNAVKKSERQKAFTVINIFLIILAVAIVGNVAFSAVDWLLGLIGIPYAQQIIVLGLVLIVDGFILFYLFREDLQKGRYGIFYNALILYIIYLILDWLILQEYLTELSLIGLGI